jgi:hypothetical protein
MSEPDRPGGRTIDRLALLLSVALVIANMATTARWAQVPGALRGWRWPYVLAVLAVVAWPALHGSRRGTHAPLPSWLPRAVAAGAALLLAALFLINWFPPATWTMVPFRDDWPPRFSSTVEGVALLRRGAFAGWQWNLLGGYATATDITQSLTLLGAVPMLAAGDRIGFHLLHLLLIVALPALVFVDLHRAERHTVVLMAVGLVCLSACGLSSTLVQSGDTNSLAGMVAVMAVLAASQRARAGAPYGASVLLAALTVAVYSHVGFFAYACGLLIVESIYYRDARHLRRAIGLAVCALLMSLPLTYELFRYPDQFNFNNVIYERQRQIEWASVLRSIGYNVQILLSPRRWFADVTNLFGPLLLVAVWSRRGRVGFYAWAAVFTVGLGLLNMSQAGYFFARPAHLLTVFTPIALAGVIVDRARTWWQAAAFAVLLALLTPIVDARVPHVQTVDDALPALTARLRAIEAPRVLIENSPHRDVDAAPDRTSEPSLYGTHFEALLPAATGKQLYASYWDGWQWTPFRGEMLAGGAWQGHMITNADHDALLAELHRWGVRDLLVWSQNATRVLATWPELSPVWRNDRWRDFQLAGSADVREATTARGTATLRSVEPLGATVQLSGVQRGDPVPVRAHYHPAWEAWAAGSRVAIANDHGQLAFIAPADGSYDVTLVYPARRWLLLIALIVAASSWIF